MTTNLERFRYFLKDISSPDSYINMSFYFIISAALQRRVWLGSPSLHPIFPSQYTILVGEAGLGKGLVLGPCKDILQFHKRLPLSQMKDLLTQSDREILTYVEKVIQAEAPGSKKGEGEDKYLFHGGPDNITYEKIVRRHGSKGMCMHDNGNIKTEMAPNGIYTYQSMYIILEELSSMFNKDAQKVTKYLLNAYDCREYEYDTKTGGNDIIPKPCLSLLGGTTPSFMQDCFDSKMIEDGLTSRITFIFESSNRFNRLFIPEPCKEQLEARNCILAHVLRLSRLFGQASYTPEAAEYLRQYYEEVLPFKRANANEKLTPYYARKNLHMQKLAMAIHFADSTGMVIGLASCMQSLKILEALEKRMHLALQFKGNNPLAGASRRVVKFLKNSNRPMSKLEIWQEIGDDVDENGLIQVLRFLLQTEKIIEDVNAKDINGRSCIKYDLKDKEKILKDEAKIKEVLKQSVEKPPTNE